jgi:hypothetical protein
LKLSLIAFVKPLENHKQFIQSTLKLQAAQISPEAFKKPFEAPMHFRIAVTVHMKEGYSKNKTCKKISKNIIVNQH